MATMNAFDLLCDDDNEDPAQLIVAVQLKTEKLKKPLALAQPQAHVQLPKAAFLPSHLLWPRMLLLYILGFFKLNYGTIYEARNEGGCGGGPGGGQGSSRGCGGSSGFNHDSNNSETAFGSNNGFSGAYRPTEESNIGKPSEKRGYGGSHGSFCGSCHGGFSNGEAREEMRSNVMGMVVVIGKLPLTKLLHKDTEEPIVENEKNIGTEKQPREEDTVDANRDSLANEPE
ncbi:hypothetical protein GH714_043547 [Hevea brasiliensis]|uniref:STM1-like N-terminal domain-containing protein n=1 Tax=Hevea brasiliensis TaxID=3981 RepID=A0A6A6K1W0_HEVBR|nr:hypothetical protein GH714_043547 [Hevea brasiliensis]